METMKETMGSGSDSSETDHTQDATIVAVLKGVVQNQAAIIANQTTMITALQSIDTQLAAGITVNLG
jgi:hypothetical protein